MKKEIDLKFFLDHELMEERIFKRVIWGKKYAHHIRISQPDAIDVELINFLKQGHNFSLQ